MMFLYIFLLFHILFSWSSDLSLVLSVVVTLVFVWSYSQFRSARASLVSNIILLIWALTITFFLTNSLFILYASFEMSLFPLTLLLVLFGYQPEKFQASLALLAYTIIGSIPLFIFVSSHLSSSINVLSSLSGYTSFVISLAFFIKSPLYFLHSWLPKAHTEAPLVGSIILAGVILKFGGYGILLLAPSFKFLASWFMFVTLVGSVICSLYCLRHWDSKSLVAYSSIVHIGTVSLGAVLATEIGWSAAVSMIVSHSLVSPILFSVCYALYISNGSRALVNIYLSSHSPLIFLVVALLLSINIGTPPFLSFWVELSLFFALSGSFFIGSFVLMLISFFVFCFRLCFYLFCFSNNKTFILKPSFLTYCYVPSIGFSLISSLSFALFLF